MACKEKSVEKSVSVVDGCPPTKTTAASMGNCCKSSATKEFFTTYGEPDYRLEKAVVKEAFLDSGKIAKALIITYPDRQVQATGPPDFHPPPKTLRNIMSAIEGKPHDLAEGIDLGEGKIYTAGKIEKFVSIYATCPEGGGCIIYKTPMSLILAVYNKEQNPDKADRLVQEMADLMAQEEESNEGDKDKKEKKTTPKEDKKPSNQKQKRLIIPKITKTDTDKKGDDDDDDFEYEKEIIHNTLYKTGKLSKVCIVGVKDHKVHATAPEDFLPPKRTIENILKALEGDTEGLATYGIELNDENMYVPGKVDKGETIVAVCPGGGGCIVYKTKKSLIIAAYEARHNPSMANRLVCETADEMKDDGK